MPCLTFKALIQGDTEILKKYQKAVFIWEGLYKEIDWDDVESLAVILSREQDTFEIECGYRSLGQEIMVITGFDMLYDLQKGFDENRFKAQNLLRAYEVSYCSLEVKGLAEDIARLYFLIE